MALCARHQQEIKLVLADLMMPHMDGVATIRALQKIHPGARIIATTGLAETPLVSAAADLGVKTILEKPFATESLLASVRAALDG